MNLEHLVKQIVYSDDPVEEFAKVAENLDENWRATLAREVNKGLFHRKLEETPLNENIEFDVIEDSSIKKTASLNRGHANSFFHKTASYNEPTHNTKVLEKKASITMDMFDVFNEEVPYIRDDKYEGRGIDPTFEKVASAENYEKEEIRAIELKRKEQQERLVKEAQMREIQIALIEKIASITDDESKMKSVLRTMVKEGMKEEAKEVMKHIPFGIDRLEKVAEVPLEAEKYTELKTLMRELKYVNDGIEKKAFLGPLVQGIGKTLSIAAKPIYTTGKLAGNAAFKAGKIGFKTGKFIVRHPAGVMTGATMIESGNRSANIFADALFGRI